MSMLIFPLSNLCIISGVIFHNCFWVLQLGVVVTFLNTIISCLVFFFYNFLTLMVSPYSSFSLGEMKMI